MANNNNRNDLLVPGSENVLNQMKLEIAAELGLQNYDQMDKGALSARDNGRIGGEMTKRLVALAQKQLAEQAQEFTPNPASISAAKVPTENQVH